MRKAFFTVPVLLGLGLPLAGKLMVESAAADVSEQLIARADGANSTATAISLTKQIHERFRSDGDVPLVKSILLRVSPYWTNANLPGLWRLEEGAADLLASKGLCDVHVRALNYVLRQSGFQAWQLNFVQKQGGAHTITSARDPEGNDLLLDPLYGVAALKDGQPLGLDAVHALIASGTPAQELWPAIVGSVKTKFYASFDSTIHARQGDPLVIPIDVQLKAGETITLGALDGKPDVNPHAGRRNWYTHWDYLGSRYDRAWDRVMRFGQDTRVTITAVAPINPRFITTDRQPAIAGNVLVYEMKKGESLVFDDGAARRDFTTFRSFQDIDQIRFEAM